MWIWIYMYVHEYNHFMFKCRVVYGFLFVCYIRMYERFMKHAHPLFLSVCVCTIVMFQFLIDSKYIFGTDVLLIDDRSTQFPILIFFIYRKCLNRHSSKTIRRFGGPNFLLKCRQLFDRFRTSYVHWRVSLAHHILCHYHGV